MRALAGFRYAECASTTADIFFASCKGYCFELLRLQKLPKVVDFLFWTGLKDRSSEDEKAEHHLIYECLNALKNNAKCHGAVLIWTKYRWGDRSFCSLDSIILQAQLLEKQNLFTGVLSTIVPLSSRLDRSSDEKKNTISISSLPISAYYYPKKS